MSHSRRQFLLAAGALLSTTTARAQSTKKRFRVGWLHTTLPAAETLRHPGFHALVSELRLFGYVQGMNLEFDIVTAEGHPERYPQLVADLLSRKADAILVSGARASLAAKNATSTVPIVMAAAGDPVKYGLVASLARPGGNVTGLSADVGTEIEGKRLELLKQAVPGVSRVSCLLTKWLWDTRWGQEYRRWAKTLGVAIEFAELNPADVTASFARVKAQHPDALWVGLSPEAHALRRQIADLALAARLPSTVPYAEGVEAGSLMSYGFSVAGLFRDAARYLDKIFKGAKPGELPVQQPSTFELAVNLKTATALGLKIPQSLLMRADRVIE